MTSEMESFPTLYSAGPHLRTSYFRRGSVLIGCPDPSTSSYMPSSYFVVHSSPEMGILVLISTPIAPSAAVNREQHMYCAFVDKKRNTKAWRSNCQPSWSTRRVMLVLRTRPDLLMLSSKTQEPTAASELHLARTLVYLQRVCPAEIVE